MKLPEVIDAFFSKEILNYLWMHPNLNFFKPEIDFNFTNNLFVFWEVT